MNADKTEIEKEFTGGREIIIQHLIASTRKILTALIMVAILILTDIISAVAQFNLEIKFEQKEYFEGLANYFVTSSSEWFIPLYSSFDIWGFITVAIPLLCFILILLLLSEIDNLIKSRGVYIFFRLPKFLVILSAFMLLVFASYTKPFIDNNPIIKDALNKAVAMHKVRVAMNRARYVDERKDHIDDSRKQCQRIVESVLAAQK